MDNINSIFLKNENMWVATDKNYEKVFVAKRDLEDLQKEVKRLNIRDAIILFVPPFESSLAPKCL